MSYKYLRPPFGASVYSDESRHSIIQFLSLYLREFQRLRVFSKNKSLDVKHWTQEAMKYTGSLDLLQQYEAWELPKFPVSGNILVEQKVPRERNF